MYFLCYAISSGETCAGESRCICACYKLWRDLFGRIPVYLVIGIVFARSPA